MNSPRISNLFKRKRNDLTHWEIIRWWETRRIAYNLLIGIAGVFTCAIILLAGWMAESLGGTAILPDPPILAIVGVILYGIMANVCYTAGWVCELISRRFWPAEATSFGRLSFTFGLIGSVATTLVPAILVVLFSVIEYSRGCPKIAK